MAGVVATLITNNDFELLSKQIDNLAFTFVTPLGTDDSDYFRHKIISDWRLPIADLKTSPQHEIPQIGNRQLAIGNALAGLSQPDRFVNKIVPTRPSHFSNITLLNRK